MAAGAPTSDLPRRDRAAVVLSILALAGLSWAYLVILAGDTAAMGNMATAMAPKPWTAADAVFMLVMWWVMMAGMMLPSALPMILTFATVNRRKRERGQAHVATSTFVAGYLVAWGAYSAAATAAQWGLEQAALLSPMMMSTSPVFGGLLLIVAGIYQFTPLKHACLRHCRSPFDFILNRWRDGPGGALAMGVEHGLYCLGCCWVAMALLFVFGVMNLLWIAALAILVLLEKAVPGGPWIARAGGAAMVAVGAALLTT